MNTTDLDHRTDGFHPAHVGHLVMGLAFAGLVGIWAVIQTGNVAAGDVRWLLPLPWVFAGAAGLLAAVVSGRRRSLAEQRTYAAARDAHEPTDLDLIQEEE